MRQYRGKRIDNGEWVYGYYLKTPLTDESTGSKPEDGWFFLADRERHCISEDSCVYEIKPETIGQDTGLCNKWDCKIYEGDIFDINGICYIEYESDRAGYILYYPQYSKYVDLDCDIIWCKKALGNIHDDKKLLT